MKDISSIASAFIKAKKQFTPALKEKSNPAFRSKYADLGACIDAVNDPLLANGIALYQETFLDDTGVTVETIMMHESGETIRFGKLHVPAAKQDPQGYGSALTYCRRYSLLAACGIAPEDDDGNAAVKAQDDTVALERARKRLEGADSVEDLTAAWKAISGHFKATPNVLHPLARLKDERLATLESA